MGKRGIELVLVGGRKTTHDYPTQQTPVIDRRRPEPGRRGLQCHRRATHAHPDAAVHALHRADLYPGLRHTGVTPTPGQRQSDADTRRRYTSPRSGDPADGRPVRAATRVRFAPGTTSATLGNQVLYTGGVERFLLNVEAGQIMTVEVTSPLSISVIAPNGALVPAAVNSGTFWSGSMPLSGDYTLSIANLGTAVNYTVTVAIPLRIAFAPGGTAITETGSLTGPGTRSYVLEAAAGQDMTVRLSASGDARPGWRSPRQMARSCCPPRSPSPPGPGRCRSAATTTSAWASPAGRRTSRCSSASPSGSASPRARRPRPCPARSPRPIPTRG